VSEPIIWLSSRDFDNPSPENDTISLSVERDKDQILIKLTDTGIGIPAEDQADLFERFHRGRNVAEYAGNGLGLAIVKAIVEAHAGHVSAKSELGRGSEFTVTLPKKYDSSLRAHKVGDTRTALRSAQCR